MTLRYLGERWGVSVLAEGPALPSLHYERENGSFKAEDGDYRVESKCGELRLERQKSACR